MKTIVIAALMICCIPVALAQDPRGAAPVDATPVAENEFVQVLRISIPAHARTPMHEVTPRVIIWLSDAHFVDHFADGTSKEEIRKAGDAEWLSPRQHAGQNLSDVPMEFIAVIVKTAPAGGGQHLHR
jgi:hypothetical protein